MKNGQPSATADLIALGTIFLDCDITFRRLVPPGAAEACRRFVEAYSPWGKRWIRLMGKGWFRAWMRCLERIALPGILVHYALRKCYLEDVVRNSLKNGSPTSSSRAWSSSPCSFTSIHSESPWGSPGSSTLVRPR